MSGKLVPFPAGQVFGKLTVTEDLGMREAGTRKFHYARVLCECGTTLDVRTNALQCGATRSCGRGKCTEKGRRTHSMAYSPEYTAWAAMLQRCENPKNPGWKDYGGRGITVCERWHKFENFLEDLGPKPEPKNKYSLGRLDNDGGYKPGNVGWQLTHDQTRNRRDNHWIEYNDARLVLADWARKLDLNEVTLLNRLKKMTVEEALTMPRSEYHRRLVRIEQFTDDQLLAELRRRGHDV